MPMKKWADPPVGKVYGAWTVTGAPVTVFKFHRGIPCRCACGTERVVLIRSLETGESKRCGACWKRRVPPGTKFGRLTVLEIIEGGRYARVRCRCDCGGEKTVHVSAVEAGLTSSCGCIGAENPNGLIHGESGTRLHWIWCGVRQRCKDANHISYPHYGGRGVTVCAEWDNDYTAFRDWALANGYAPDLMIDRRDVNGNYEPSNCRWVTPVQSARNMRTNHLLTAFGETKCLAEWMEDPRCRVKYNTLWNRLKRGITPEEALTQAAQIQAGRR